MKGSKHKWLISNQKNDLQGYGHQHTFEGRFLNYYREERPQNTLIRIALSTSSELTFSKGSLCTTQFENHRNGQEMQKTMLTKACPWSRDLCKVKQEIQDNTGSYPKP